MAVSKEARQSILKTYRRSDLDTGSPEVQVALLTARINEMTVHFQTHKKDLHSQRGLVKAVNQRRKLLDYLRRTNLQAYEKLIKSLDIRK
ncbi:MAG: 30S ribosomal protein S15 [Bdellovibrionaceae bacterium]|nr:30S ribosomal protein S15 [Pseudobdellovibrionaceae bacterium]